ncbi:uncharacterized protein EI97DRAFT_450995 [Westerdykella ornata]|uniref:Zn(2)-C6 fungal-type domain-containing protein n=1 Tax=Westerdykella ornata TaxID=318751 RepID=A0A6A6JHJ2_WESOR|nr:uncharacterized protein EI97DRAFT_450995 [Westerdykella ornata]KAF2275428.1 hypothetical protein EI97DRAFT_450995 [Westerdykella ornata]
MGSPASASETADVRTTASSQSVSHDTPQVDDVADAPGYNSPINHDEKPEQTQKTPGGPLQKRRRVTRACDECRRKKIKCDGKQPCTHCTVYSYECTYDQPSNRRRNAPPQYVEALETQLKRAKALLSMVLPAVDLNDPNLDLNLQNGVLPPRSMPVARPQDPVQNAPMQPVPQEPMRDESQDWRLESMVKATGQLDLDADGKWDYHGHSSGLTFMRRLQQQFGDIMPLPEPAASPLIKNRPRSYVFDSPISAHHSPVEHHSTAPPATDLPPKAEAKALCDSALIDSGALMRVVHLPSFYKLLDRVYDVSPDSYGSAEHSFLPLLYAVLALGTLFSSPEEPSEEHRYETDIDHGASRQLLDIADCRDLTSLQAVVFMIQFLQSSAKLPTCYAYIGVAMRSALRLGLHRSFSVNFNPIEAEVRKRLFWTIRRMDIYVGAMLGLPIFLRDEDVDQEWPVEVDDEYITETDIRSMPQGEISVIAASNAHTRLVLILSDICKHVYPIKGTQSDGNSSVTYTVSYSKIRQLEKALQYWLDELPEALRPASEASPIMMRVQQLLRMAFGHAQLLLYRPFLHYVSRAFRTQAVDQRAFACASACISVSRNIIHITEQMNSRGLLIGAYWFSMYTTFFAIISILYFVLENPTGPTSHELYREAERGKAVLAQFAERSMAADRCTKTLNSIFERLPERMKRVAEDIHAVAGKKRGQGHSPQLQHNRPARLQPEDFVAADLRRANTLPETMPDHKPTSGSTLPVSQAQLTALGIDPAYARASLQPKADFYESRPNLTPTSATTIGGSFVVPVNGKIQHQPNHSFPATPLGNSFVEPTGLSVPLSDVSAMMFPSPDPFAYPNQPMTTFENNNNPQGFKADMPPTVTSLPYQVAHDMKPPVAFDPGSLDVPVDSRPWNDTDVQVFGPMPMYLMQGAQQRSNIQSRTASQNIQMTSSPSTGNMNFADLLGGEEWANTFMDQSLGLNNARSGYGNHPDYGLSGGSGPQNWR